MVARFVDAPGVGFNDPALGEARREILEYAVSTLNEGVKGPITIFVDVSFANLENEIHVTGQPLAIFQNFQGAFLPVRYGCCVANQLACRDLNGPQSEAEMIFNLNTDFHYGTGYNPPPGKVDFLTTVRHQIIHGMGFYTDLDPETGLWPDNDTPDIMAARLTWPGMGDLMDLEPFERLQAIQDNALVWNGPATMAALGGETLPMLATTEFVGDKCIFHIEPDFRNLPDLLMEPLTGAGNANNDIIGPLLQDIGWTLVDPNEGALLAQVLDHISGVAEMQIFEGDANGDGAIDVGDVVHMINTPDMICITNLIWEYSSPYLLDFTFTLRDGSGNAIIVPPGAISVTPMENSIEISSETGFQIAGRESKQLRTFVVLDYTSSIASTATNPDSDGDGKTDAVETMEAATKLFLESLNEDAQIGIIVFNRSDRPPAIVSEFTNDHEHLSELIDTIWTDVVQQFPADSNVWDAVHDATSRFNSGSARDEQRFVIFLSDGNDTSSSRAPQDIINLATSLSVRVFSIGFGAELDPTDLLNITAGTNGRYFQANTVAAMAAQFQEIISDLGGTYTLRWATLRRAVTPFIPSFNLSIGNVSGFSPPGIASYIPPDHAGNPVQGALRFSGTEPVNGQATVFLRAEYVPRLVRRIRMQINSPKSFAVDLVPPTGGGLVSDWTLTRTTLASGEDIIEIASPNPDDPATSLPFASFGPLLRFRFQDIDSLDEIFANIDDVMMDNSIYESTGGQSFRVTNKRLRFDRNTYASGITGASDVGLSDFDSDGFLDVAATAAGSTNFFYWRSQCGYAREQIGLGIGANEVRFLGENILVTSPLQQGFFWYDRIVPQPPTKPHWGLVRAQTGVPGAVAGNLAVIDNGGIDIVGGSSTSGAMTWYENPGGFAVRGIASLADVADMWTVDFNGSGTPDVVACSPTTGHVSWWSNINPQGGAQFDPQEHVITSSFLGVTEILPVDLDQDGDLDVLGVSPSTGSVAWWRRNSLTSFTEFIFDLGSPGILGVAAGDIDGDGDLDVAGCSDTEEKVWWWENDGMMSFNRSLVWDGIGPDPFRKPSSVAVGDYDNDGDADVFSTSSMQGQVGQFVSTRFFSWD
jgi:hypothetical protein